jgi:hypothetical protein
MVTGTWSDVDEMIRTSKMSVLSRRDGEVNRPESLNVAATPLSWEEQGGSAAGEAERLSDEGTGIGVRRAWLKEAWRGAKSDLETLVQGWRPVFGDRQRLRAAKEAIKNSDEAFGMILGAAAQFTDEEAEAVHRLWHLWCLYNVEFRALGRATFPRTVTTLAGVLEDGVFWMYILAFGSAFRKACIGESERFEDSDLVDFQKYVAESVLERSFTAGRRTDGAVL